MRKKFFKKITKGTIFNDMLDDDGGSGDDSGADPMVVLLVIMMVELVVMTVVMMMIVVLVVMTGWRCGYDDGGAGGEMIVVNDTGLMLG